MNTIEDMEALLSMSIDAMPDTVVKVGKSQYHQLIQHRNLRTYSTTEKLHDCPRLFERMKLDAFVAQTERANNSTFAFGHAVGAGVAEFDRTGDRRAAIWAAFLAWDVDLLEENRKIGGKGGESFFEAVWALYAYEAWYQDNIMRDYDVIAVEATVLVDLEDGSYYSGHVDELLRSKSTGAYLVKENKTDGSATIDPAKYSNSDQALGYSVVIDMLGASEYGVMYVVYSKQEQTWHDFMFIKGANSKAEWIQDQLLLNQQVDHYAELNFFPKRGSSCIKYGRRCPYYERCDMDTKSVYGITFDELPRVTGADTIHAIEKVDYFTTMTDIVKRQQQRTQG